MSDWHRIADERSAEIVRLMEENAKLREQVEEDEQLRDRLRDILVRTAEALKGPPPPLTLHDWSDLPDVARDLKEGHRIIREFAAGLERGIEVREQHERGMRVVHAFALGRIAKAVGFEGKEYDGMPLPELAGAVEARMELRDLDMQNEGCSSTCEQLRRAFDEIDEWLAGKSDKTEPPEFFFGSPLMNELCRRYQGRTADFRTELEKF